MSEPAEPPFAARPMAFHRPARLKSQGPAAGRAGGQAWARERALNRLGRRKLAEANQAGGAFLERCNASTIGGRIGGVDGKRPTPDAGGHGEGGHRWPW